MCPSCEKVENLEVKERKIAGRGGDPMFALKILEFQPSSDLISLNFSRP